MLPFKSPASPGASVKHSNGSLPGRQNMPVTVFHLEIARGLLPVKSIRLLQGVHCRSGKFPIRPWRRTACRKDGFTVFETTWLARIASWLRGRAGLQFLDYFAYNWDLSRRACVMCSPGAAMAFWSYCDRHTPCSL